MKDNFTAREVAVLFEQLRSEIRTIGEVLVPLPGRISVLEERVTNLETEVRSVIDVIRIAIPGHEKRITRLETKVGI